MNAASRTGAALAAAALWIAGVAGAYGDGTAWYMNTVSNFTYRQEITISGSLTDGALTNFPLLVAITNQDNPIFAKAQSNGNDIVFTTADGRTNLAYEMETYTNSGNKQLIAWVNMPVLAPGQSTTILMLYGNPSLPSQQNKAGAWTNNFLGVWHLNEAVSNGGTNYDSSPSGANAVRYGSGAGGATGKIGGGNAYNGSDDYSQGSGVAINTNGFTVSAWCYLADTHHGFYAIETGNDGAQYLGLYGDGTPLFSVLNAAYGQVGTFGPAQSFSNWHYVVAVARPTYNQLFVDGVESSGTWGTPAGFASYLRCKYIGSAGPWGSPWQGTLDELRMCGEARSVNWVTACYRNQNNPSYLTIGSEKQTYQWEYRQKITVAAAMTPNTDQTDFPMLALITNQDNHLFGAARSDGGDILFTASDGVTKLSHEIETYTNSGVRQLAAWVKAPVLSHTNDTVFYMYYGNPTALRQTDSVAVWTNNFLGVWHLNEAVSAGGTNYDSSPSGANAVRYGSGAGGVTGKIGGGNAYNGTDDFSAGPGGAINTNGFTLSAWVYSQQEGTKIIECGGDTHNYLCTVGNAGGLFSQLDGATNQITCYTPTNMLTVSNWHYVVAVAVPSSSYLFYVDGNFQGAKAANGILSGNRAVYIGHYVTQNNINWNGMLDEMRFCGVARSADWIKTCYNNQNSPSSYISFSNKQARTGGMVFMFR